MEALSTTVPCLLGACSSTSKWVSGNNESDSFGLGEGFPRFKTTWMMTALYALYLRLFWLLFEANFVMWFLVTLPGKYAAGLLL